MSQSKTSIYEHPLANINLFANSNGVAALYCRLSSDDGREGESNSIINQRKLLKQRASELGFAKTKVYIDDGITGTTFERKGFLEMLSDIEKGIVSTVIVKDLSRFGRNNSEILHYIEIVFPENNIRFISLNEGIDSITGTNDVLPFLSMVAEHYAKDISRKVRSVKYMKGNSGEPLGLPPYGYTRKSKEENFWIIEEEPAKVVRRIYEMYLTGRGVHQIACVLMEEEILTPTHYWQAKGIGRGGKKRIGLSPYAWGSNTIIKILDNQAYVGDIINFQTYKISFKSKKCIDVPKEQQKIFKDVHEPIIERQIFEQVQQKRTKRSKIKPQKNGEQNMFSGLLFCSDCKSRLHLHRYNTTGDEYFSCSNYKGNSTKGTCETTHHIRIDYLTQVLLFEITKLIYYSQIYTEDFLKIVMDSTIKRMEQDGKNRYKELEKLKVREQQLDILFQKIYEDQALGKISDERFVKLSHKYEEEQAEINKKIRILQTEISKEEDHIGTADEFIHIIKKYSDLQELTPEVVKAFISRIVVWNAQKQDGKRIQKIEIYYNCVGNISLPQHKDMPKPQINLSIRKGVVASYSSSVSEQSETK